MGEEARLSASCDEAREDMTGLVGEYSGIKTVSRLLAENIYVNRGSKQNDDISKSLEADHELIGLGWRA